MAESDLDHLMATFHVEALSPTQIPVDSNQFGDVYPIADTQNPSSLRHNLEQIPRVTLDDVMPVDVNDFMQLGVPEGSPQFHNSYSNYSKYFLGPSLTYAKNFR